MKIAFEPLGHIDDGTAEALMDRVGRVFGCPTEPGQGLSDLATAFDPQREQYLSTKLLALLKNPEGDGRVVGVTEVDLYVPGLNYVFGEADPLSRTAIVSLCRLRQEYYGLEPDERLFFDRAVKEIVHELGHTFGLGHCTDNKCVMHFSNSLADTDFKAA
ncbi:MAG: archaemetzincin family Zn-dependent metalloprotease, partial [Dehalococcoidia bacterium]